MEKEHYIKPVKNLLYMIAFLWIVHIISYFLPINQYGIIPRETSGLTGILFAPLLHHDFSHLSTNSASFFILGMFLITMEHGRSFWIVAAIVVLGGLGTWLIGRPGTVHIGASGVIYGILGFLIARGLFRRDFKTLLISIIVFFLYCGMIFGVLPVNYHMSWESHLCGFLSGILLASTYGRK
jgi:membrane associated rhomboid family serine protease